MNHLCAETILDGPRIDDNDSGRKTGVAAEMADVERQQVGYLVHVTNGDEAGVVDLFADDAEGRYQGFPGGVDRGCFVEQWKSRFV